MHEVNFDISGQVAVITGAGGIICGVMAREMAKTGARVALLALFVAHAQKIADEINAAGGDAIAVKANVLDRASLEEARDAVVAKYGHIDILINGVGGAVPSWLVAPMAFLLVALTVFAVGGCWAVMTIALPVFIPMGLAAGAAPSLMIAAVMSGVTLGYSICFYADAVFMTTAGTGVSNITTIRATLPYALTVGALSAAAFLVAGL